MEQLCVRSLLVCFAVALRWGVQNRAGDVWGHLTSWGGAESGSRAGLGSRGLSNGEPTNVLAPPPLLVLTSQCLAAEPLTQPRRGKTSPAPATTEECATHIPPTTPAQVWG